MDAVASSWPEVRLIVAEPVVEGFLGAPAPGAMNPIPEGPAFDREGRLYFVSAFPDADGYRVFRLDPDSRVITRILNPGDSAFASIAIHRDGRLFLADFFGGQPGYGRVAVAEADGSGLRTVVDEFEGTPIIPDDLVFAPDGVIYYNDFQGDAANPVGRVIRLQPDGTQSLVMSGFAHPNGIAFTPAGDRLWVSDHLTNRLLSFAVGPSGPGSDLRVHAHFSGGLLDSTTVDAVGNVYQAVYDGGRVELLDPDANRLAVVVPGDRPRERHIRTTHVAIRPGTRDAYLVAGGPEGIGIFRFEALAPAAQLYSHS